MYIYNIWKAFCFDTEMETSSRIVTDSKVPEQFT